MAAILLPSQAANINYGGVPLPPQPSNPPTDTDVYNSQKFNKQVYEYRQVGSANDAAVAEAARYTARVLDNAQPPAWAVQIQQTLNNVQQSVRSLERIQAKTHALIAKRENHLTIPAGPFQEVPFPNGTWPWGAQVAAAGGQQVQLPNLDSVQAVRNLNLNESYGYFAGYYPNSAMPVGPNAVATRVLAILKAIGKGDLV